MADCLGRGLSLRPTTPRPCCCATVCLCRRSCGTAPPPPSPPHRHRHASSAAAATTHPAPSTACGCGDAWHTVAYIPVKNTRVVAPRIRNTPPRAMSKDNVEAWIAELWTMLFVLSGTEKKSDLEKVSCNFFAAVAGVLLVLLLYLLGGVSGLLSALLAIAFASFAIKSQEKAMVPSSFSSLLRRGQSFFKGPGDWFQRRFARQTLLRMAKISVAAALTSVIVLLVYDMLGFFLLLVSLVCFFFIAPPPSNHRAWSKVNIFA